jgi:hypothetical protein
MIPCKRVTKRGEASVPTHWWNASAVLPQGDRGIPWPVCREFRPSGFPGHLQVRKLRNRSNPGGRAPSERRPGQYWRASFPEVLATTGRKHEVRTETRRYRTPTTGSQRQIEIQPGFSIVVLHLTNATRCLASGWQSRCAEQMAVGLKGFDGRCDSRLFAGLQRARQITTLKFRLCPYCLKSGVHVCRVRELHG